MQVFVVSTSQNFISAIDRVAARNDTEERGDETQQKGTKLTVLSVIPSQELLSVIMPSKV